MFSEEVMIINVCVISNVEGDLDGLRVLFDLKIVERKLNYN